MLCHARLPGQFWAEAENLARTVMSYTLREGKDITGYEILYGVKLSFDLIHPFGCHGFTHVPKVD